MDNPEEMLHLLAEFVKLKPKEIPAELEQYLGYVAKTGDPIYQWPLVKALFREKLVNVITEFYETCPAVEPPPACPNVDAFNYESMKVCLVERLDSFASAPFTVQRLCELLTAPRKQYSRADKFMRAVEKNMLVVSTREPSQAQATRHSDADMANGEDKPWMDRQPAVPSGERAALELASFRYMGGAEPFGPAPDAAAAAAAFYPPMKQKLDEFLETDAAVSAIAPEIANLAGISPDQVASLAGISPDQVANLAGISADQVANLAGISPEQVANLAGISPDQVANLAAEILPDVANLAAAILPEQVASLVAAISPGNVLPSESVGMAVDVAVANPTEMEVTEQPGNSPSQENMEPAGDKLTEAANKCSNIQQDSPANVAHLRVDGNVTANPEAVVNITANPQPVDNITANPELIQNNTAKPEPIENNTANPKSNENISAKQEALVNIAVNPDTVENITSNEETVVNITSNSEAVENVSGNPESVVNISANQEDVVNIAVSPKAVENIASNQESVGNITANEETVVNITANQETVVNITANPEPVVNITANQEVGEQAAIKVGTGISVNEDPAVTIMPAKEEKTEKVSASEFVEEKIPVKEEEKEKLSSNEEAEKSVCASEGQGGELALDALKAEEGGAMKMLVDEEGDQEQQEVDRRQVQSERVRSVIQENMEPPAKLARLEEPTS